MFCPANFRNQWLQKFNFVVFIIKLGHKPQVTLRKPTDSGEFLLQFPGKNRDNGFAPALPLSLGNIFAYVPIESDELGIDLFESFILGEADFFLVGNLLTIVFFVDLLPSRLASRQIYFCF